MKLSNQGKDILISDFDEVDALRLALKLEADGIRYYEELSKKTKDKDISDTFKRLIKEESKHSEKFKGWLEDAVTKEGLDIEADRGDEESLFDFINTGVFGDIWDVDETLSNIKTDKDAISLAEWVELNSIKFYRAMYDKTGSESGKRILKDVIKEEQLHLKSFERYRELLEKTQRRHSDGNC